MSGFHQNSPPVYNNPDDFLDVASMKKEMNTEHRIIRTETQNDVCLEWVDRPFDKNTRCCLYQDFQDEWISR